MQKSRLILALALLVAPLASRAQDAATTDADELKVIEVELEKSAPRQAPEAPRPAEPVESAAPKTPEFSDLGALAPFREVSVIQKRYLPKTGRFGLFAGLSTITNDPFNNAFGGLFKANYFLSETWGVELSYFAMSNSEAKTTQELREIEGVVTKNLVKTKGSALLDVMWVPVYGKMSWFNKSIVPFDLYFSLGGGQSQIESSKSESVGTLHIAAGQMFAASKGSAFRWDFSWNFFSATGVDLQKSSYNNLFLSAGWTWFFPEAKYR